MNRVRVVHLCRGRDWRGGERQVRLLTRVLAPRTDLTQLIAAGRTSRLAEALLDDGRQVLQLPWAAAWDPRAWLGLVRQLRAIRRDTRPLLLHAHDSHALALGLLASRRLGLPLVATRRSVAPAGRLWRSPDRVIAISGAVERMLVECGVAQAGIVRIPSAIDVAQVRTARPGNDAGGPRVIAVGALTPEKGHATLIDALALLAPAHPEVRLLLLGQGAERAALEARSKRHGVESRVSFAGEVADPAARIAAATIFVQPSYREALGTAVLEAMALGIPVVASRTGGLPELLGDDAGLLVPPRDPAALATAIGLLLDSPALRTALAVAARGRLAEFDAPRMAERVVAVYRSALGDP